jgi:UTP-glucose-1-phosphate uridylyltransferase
VRLIEQEGRYDIGTPLTYYKAFADFALADAEHGEAFRHYLNHKLAE